MTNSHSPRPPSFWKVAPGVCWLQVHSPQQARKVNRRPDAKQVAYSVAGGFLRTFEISKPERWVKDYVSRQLYANEGFLLLEGRLRGFSSPNATSGTQAFRRATAGKEAANV